MSVSIVATPTIGSNTFYRNSPFDISFSIANTAGSFDTSLYFSNSTYGVRPYVSNGHFKSLTPTTGIPSLGSLGTLSVDVLSSNARVVSTVTPQSYLGTVGVCTDPSGNVYFAHANGNKIYRVDPSGAITTFAGTGTSGDDDGDRLTTAQFRGPAFVITDGSGTFYVTDQFRVRKIDSNGLVSTIAGTSNQAYVDGTGTSARFWSPGGMALSPNGSLMVTDNDYHTVRNVTLPDGVVTTYAGRPGFAAFADGSLNSIVTAGGQFVRGANSGISTLYNAPDVSGAWTSNTTAVTMPVYTMVNSLNSNSNVILYGGQYSSNYPSPLVYQSNLQSPVVAATGFGATFANILAIAYEASLSKYLAGGSGSNHAPYVSTDGGATWTDYSSGNNVLSITNAIAYGGSTWMAVGVGSNGSFSNVLISTTSAGTAWTRTAATGLLLAYTVAYAGGTWAVGGLALSGKHIATSTDSGATWTSRDISVGGDAFRAVTKLVYAAGIWVASFEIGGGGRGVGLVYSSDLSSWSNATGDLPTADVYVPAGLVYSTTQRRFITALDSNIAYSANGVTWSVASNVVENGMTSFIDVSQSPGTYTDYGTARLFFPGGLLYDPAGTLYVADQYNNRIRRVAAGSSTMTTYAGSGEDATSNGTLDTAAMARPISLARDSNGTIYVGSFERNTLQTIIGNNVSLLAGAPFSAGYVDGAPATARFNGLAGIAVFRDDLYMGEVYNADVRKLTTLPDVRPGLAPPGYRIIATSNYPINVNSRIDVCWTSVGGTLPLFKFEPFSNTFTANGSGGTSSDTLTYSTTSPELLAYLTGTGTSNVAFRGPNGATIAYPYTLTLEVRANSNNTVVDDVSTSVTISPARVIVTPCNANLVFYRNEPSTNPVFSLVSSSAQIIYSASTLPTGLSFARTASNAFALTGTPTVQTFASNYSILGQDTSGRTYATQVSMIVNPERLIIDVSGSLSLSGLSSNAPIEPITFTSRFPPYNAERAVTYSWFPAPPAGLQFRRKHGFAVSGLSAQVLSTVDPSFELTLSGTITQAQIEAYASNNVTSTSIVLNGVRTNGGGLLSPAIPKTITFSFAETVLFDSNVPRLYVGQPVSNFYYSAKTYFPFISNSITSIEIIDGFLPDGLDASFTQSTQRFTFAGTPTTASTYAFTLQATNNTSNATTVSLPILLTTSNDSITISPLADACYNFIQFRPLSSGKTGFYPSSIRYTGTAASGGTVVLTGSNLPTGVSLVATDASAGIYDLSGVPTTPAGSSVATLTASVALTGATATKTFAYSVSAEAFTFNDLSLSFIENVPITSKVVTATTLSEQPIIRYSSPSIPAELQIANTGRITGTVITSNDGTFDVTAYTPFSTGTKTYSYTVKPDSVLLQPTTYRTVTAPGGNVSIQINGYSASATTVSNFQISGGSYGLGIGSTSGLLSGTLASSLPTSTTFTLAGSAGDVTGTLVGTMATDNLTTNRAQMIEIRSTSNLYIYYSDDKGATWEDAYSQSNLLASRIGTNGSNLYLVPTSSATVLASTTGSNFTTRTVSNAVGYDPRFTGIANKPGTSTWWIAGTLSNVTRSAYVFKSTDDGVSWGSGVQVTTNGFADRAGNPASYSTSNAYLNGGISIAYKDGVLLLGGNQVLRSEDEGSTWSTVSTGLIEVADFSLDQDTVWLAVGSSLYPSPIDLPYEGDATTIVYSTDQGLTWSPSPGPFVRNAYQVLYARGAWMVVGLTGTGLPYTISICVSFDGVNWSPITFPPAGFAAATDVYPSGPLAPIGFDETDWKLGSVSGPYLYSHPYDTPLLADWTSNALTGGSLSGVTSTSRFYSYIAQTIDPGADITTITFPLPNTGPVFTSPAQTTYILWQYMPLPPVTFLAPGATNYFISPLPVGLTWDPITQTLTGACVNTGTQTFTVYAQNSGLTALVITLIVEVPRIVKQQTGAGAYTSLVRQYTTVNAAQNARDTRAFPTQVSGIGEFASPYPPDVITPSNCPC